MYSLYRLQVKVYVYCAWQIHAHLRCTQCSIPLHLMDICLLPCIYLWQISQIHTCLFVVVGPAFVSTSPAFMRSSASHPAGPHGRIVQKTVNRASLLGREISTQFAKQFVTAVTTPPLVGCVIWSPRHLFLRLINQSFAERRLPKERQNASSHLTTPGFFESHGTI